MVALARELNPTMRPDASLRGVVAFDSLITSSDAWQSPRSASLRVS